VVLLALVLPGSAYAGSISGNVTDQISGKPVKGVKVGAGPVGYGLRDYTETAVDGSYQIDDLEAGRFNVCFLPAPGVNLLRQCWHDSSHRFYGEAIDVPAEGRVTGIDAELAPGTSIAGRVTDWDGNPLEGVCVAAWTPQSGGTRRAADAGTDERGAYTLTGLTPGAPHEVVFAPDGGGMAGCSNARLYPGFANQWFNLRPNQESADEVTAARSETRAGVNGILGRSSTPPAASTPAAHARCTVPRLKNRTFTSARTLLARAGCSTPMPATRLSRSFRRGRVIKSRPGPRQRLRRGARVKLVVSKGH
jgi:hypothetical protein